MTVIEPPDGDRAFDLEHDDLLAVLRDGEMEIEGRMPYSSNATLLVTMRTDEHEHRAIYKPGRGERPLWDFPDGLYQREVAMFELADQLGVDVIPPTVLVDGDLGPGSLQAFVHAHYDQHYFTLMERFADEDTPEAERVLADLRTLCLLDLVANNTDRKGGHCLFGGDGRVYGIDHGIAFHAQFKLRTVMWDFVDEEIPTQLLAPLRRFVADGPRASLCELLDPFEVDALMTRASAVLEAGVYPDDDTGGQRYPWPLV